LALKGSYDRYGAIDGIEQDENAALVLEFFLGKLRMNYPSQEAPRLAQ